MRGWANVGLRLGQRCRRLANHKPTFGQRPMFAGPDNTQPLVVRWPNIIVGLAQRWLPTLARRLFATWQLVGPLGYIKRLVTALGRRLSNLSLQPSIQRSGKRRPNPVMQRWLYVGPT